MDVRTSGLCHSRHVQRSFPLFLLTLFVNFTSLTLADDLSVEQIFDRYQCVRCHEPPDGVNGSTTEQSCFECHRSILWGELGARYPVRQVNTWRENIHHMVASPSLRKLESRLTQDWIVKFLMNPTQVRPALGASMPRLNITQPEAKLLAGFLTKKSETVEAMPPSRGDWREGLQLLRSKGCFECHSFGVVNELKDVPNFRQLRKLDLAHRMAPDLSLVRDRMTPAILAAWLDDPARVSPGTLMPKFVLTVEEKSHIEATLFHAAMIKFPDMREFSAPKILQRKVSYREVDRAVFSKICRHCHTEPKLNMGDGGPGNTGGFGFAGKGIAFNSFEALSADSKIFQRLLAVDRSGMPLLVRVLVARHRELAGQNDPEVRGMPLGLPPIELEDIELVQTWIAQGAKGSEGWFDRIAEQLQ